jgi:hypothetical protein
LAEQHLCSIDQQYGPLDPAACAPRFLAQENLHLAHITAGFARIDFPSSLSIIRLASAPLLTFAGLAYGPHKQNATPHGALNHADEIRQHHATSQGSQALSACSQMGLLLPHQQLLFANTITQQLCSTSS